MAFKYLTRTPSSNGNRKTWTFSAWIKRGKIGQVQCFFGSESDSPLQFTSADQLLVVVPSATQSIKTNRAYRDTSNWYHIVVACDTTQATASNRVRIWTNGVLETDLAQTTQPTQNVDTGYNSTSYVMYLGANRSSDLAGFDGMMADFYWVDGQALDASYFGQTSATNGQWVPKTPPAVRTGVGSFGTNGCYLPFTNRSSTTTLGYDYKAADRSGTLCDWSANNMTVADGVPEGNDNNFCCINTNSMIISRTLSDGNLRINSGNDGIGTFGVKSGKWYWEMQRTNTGVTPHWGITSSNGCGGGDSMLNGTNAGMILIRNDYSTGDVNGQFNNAYGISSLSSELGTPASTANGDIITFHLDLDSTPKTFKMYKNGVSGTPIMSRTFSWDGSQYWILPYCRNNSGAETLFNFGQGTTGSNYSDGNGYGRFNYQPPSGFLSLCSKNIPTPAITNSPANFNVLTWSGDGTNKSFTGLGFKPDLVWVKSRSGSDSGYYHRMSSRHQGGSINYLSPHTTDGAQGTTNGYVSSYDSDGFSVVASAGGVNSSGSTYVAWCWKFSGGVGATNTSGSITTTVYANPTAGQSLVTYTGTGTAGTIGHGLGTVPVVWLWKNTSTTSDWILNTTLLGGSQYAIFNSGSAGFTNQGSPWSTTPTTSVISIGGSDTNTNANGNNYIMLAFTEVPGYSKFGRYVGNNSSDGTFVYTGFKPGFILVKYTSNYDWHIFDSKRDPNNINGHVQKSNALIADFTQASTNIDIFSNGFKFKGNDAALNGGAEFFMAFAEAPQTFANAR
jgi:hypothetical protein